MSDGPFKVEEDGGGCPRCGQGKTWVIVDEDGDTAFGVSWSPNEDGQCPDEAQEFCNAMNYAYARGARAAK